MRWLYLVLLCTPGLAAAESFTGRVVAVIDGDTLSVEDAQKRVHRIRLAEIDAPEKGQPYYVESARSLARICLGKQAEVDAVAPRKRGRRPGKVTCDKVAANIEQVRRGMAWARARQTLPGSLLYESEANARLRQLGLWAGDKPMPPWEWRKQQSAK